MKFHINGRKYTIVQQFWRDQYISTKILNLNYIVRQWLDIMSYFWSNTCYTPVRMTRANNVLKYQSLDQSLVQYII
jgi:hypothetical protein